jgi:hypothetical protein
VYTLKVCYTGLLNSLYLRLKIHEGFQLPTLYSYVWFESFITSRFKFFNKDFKFCEKMPTVVKHHDSLWHHEFP